MTNRTTIYVDYCCTDPIGGKYGVFRKKTQSGSNWKKGERRFENHPYTATLESYNMPLVTVTEPLTHKTYQRSSLQFSRNFKANPANDVYIKALNKLYGNVKGSDFNAAVSSAELHQSVRMIGDNARRIAKAYKSVKRGNFGEAYRALAMKGKTPGKNTATHWLELQYGWLPLLKDVKAATEFISHRMQDPSIPRYRVRASNVVTGSNIPNAWSEHVSETRCQLIYYPTAALSLNEALGLTDPYSVLWEKLPYSFVIDWFLPIGPWLEATSAARTLKGAIIRTDTNTEAASGLIGQYPFTEIAGGQNSTSWRKIVTRTVASQPMPPQLPTFKPLEKALSVQHALNGIALLANLKR